MKDIIPFDPFDVTPDECLADEAIPFMGNFPNNQAFDGESFFNHLNEFDETYLWIMTYTASLHCPLVIFVERLIFQKGIFPCHQHIQLNGIHSKLYIHFNKKKKNYRCLCRLTKLSKAY